MSFPTNLLQQVQTYQSSALAYLQNLNCLVNTFNTKFKNFNDITSNLGSSVLMDLPYRFTTSNTLVVNFQPIAQRIQTLTIDNAQNVGYAVTAQDQIFNLDKDSYMEKVGKGAIVNLSQKIEQNLALNFTSSVPVGDINGNPTGALHTESGPYRFYGNGSTPINSYQQLQQAIVNFKDYGVPDGEIKVYLPVTVTPAIIGTGLNQFAPNRNNDIAMSWEIGTFGGATYYVSNNLPIHTSGSVGNNAQTLTVISTNDPTGNNITQITFSGANTSDSGAIKSGDMFQFNWNVSGQPNLYYAQFTGYGQTAQPVQFRATADAASDGSGHVTVSIYPALSMTPGANQNIFYNIVAGMTAFVTPSHRAGAIVSGNAAFLAMPRLPDVTPFPTSAEYDPDTGVSLRMYFGSLIFQNQMGMAHDCVWGSTLVPEYGMRLLFPPNN